MLKQIFKYAFMIRLGAKYVKIYKKTFFHPFISLKPAYRRLSQDRQNYSNSILDFLNVDVEVVGSLPQKDKILYAINHRSLLDILVMERVFANGEKSGVWIAKQELLDAFYGKFFEYSGCMSVDLENGKGLLTFFRNMKKTLKKVDDLNVYIFPEGERFNGQGVSNFQSGAEKIAKANRLDIVPIYIDDTLETVFKNAPYKEKRVIKVHIGDIVKEGGLTHNYKNLVEKTKEGKTSGK